jgi:hypothetical protein
MIEEPEWLTGVVVLLALGQAGCGSSGGSPAFGQSATFDGATSYVLATQAVGTIAMNKPFTVEAFIEPLVAPTAGPGTIFSLGNSASTTGANIQFFLDSNLALNGEFTSCAGSPTFLTTSTKPLSTGSFYHVAMTSDGAGHLNLFINGKMQAGTVAAGAATLCNYDTLLAGAAIANGGGEPPTQVPINYFGGVMDELRFSKVVRYTASFSEPTAPFTSDSNTILLLHLDFNTSSSALGPGDFLNVSPTLVSYSGVWYGNSPFPGN